MPDPVKAPPEGGEGFQSPPEELVNDLKFELSKQLSDKFEQEPMAYEKQRNIANEAINELAYLKAFLKHNGIEVK
jgi:hypothetical protein